MAEQAKSILTPEMRAFIGKTGERVEAWGVVDEEYLRRFAQAVPDGDPLYWDEEYARKSMFKGLTVPPTMCTYMTDRRPLSEFTGSLHANEGQRPERGRLPRLPAVPSLNRGGLQGGLEVEIYQYPKLGDRISYQRRYADIQERTGGDGRPILVTKTETTYWNQNNEVLCKLISTGIRR